MTRKFEVEDRVWNMRFGWGTVRKIKETITYSILVVFDFDNTEIMFTADGKDCEGDLYQSLFFEEITIPETARKRPKWRASHGGMYYFIDTFGDICQDNDHNYRADFRRFKAGNYFKTEDGARASNIYKAFHGEL